MSAEVESALIAAGAVVLGVVLGAVCNLLVDLGRSRRAEKATRKTDMRAALLDLQDRLEEVLKAPFLYGDWWPLIHARGVRVDDLELDIILSDFHTQTQNFPPDKLTSAEGVTYHWSAEVIEAYTNAHERIGNLLHGVPNHPIKRKPTERPFALDREGGTA